MPYKKLSELIQAAENPQRSDAFLKRFREAVRTGTIDAVFLPERFTLPKQFARRGSSETYSKDARDMVVEVTPDVEQWLETTQQTLGSARRNARVKPSLEAIESGDLDFRALVEETRRKMAASHQKGQSLGQSRTKAVKKDGRKTTRRK